MYQKYCGLVVRIEIASPVSCICTGLGNSTSSRAIAPSGMLRSKDRLYRSKSPSLHGSGLQSKVTLLTRGANSGYWQSCLDDRRCLDMARGVRVQTNVLRRPCEGSSEPDVRI